MFAKTVGVMALAVNGVLLLAIADQGSVKCPCGCGLPVANCPMPDCGYKFVEFRRSYVDPDTKEVVLRFRNNSATHAFPVLVYYNGVRYFVMGGPVAGEIPPGKTLDVHVGRIKKDSRFWFSTEGGKSWMFGGNVPPER